MPSSLNCICCCRFVAPGAPTNLRTENLGNRSITLQWNKPDRHGEAVQRYRVTFEFLYYILLASLFVTELLFYTFPYSQLLRLIPRTQSND